MTAQKAVKAEGYTTEDLLAALANGVAVELADGQHFAIADEKARQALAFFLLDPMGSDWLRSPVSKGHRDQSKLVDWMAKPSLPPLPTPPSDRGNGVRWRLVSVTAKQFGGLQPFCLEDGSDAPDVTVSMERPVFMAQGPNGAGKSSLVRAITFLLTGQVFGAHDFQPFNHPDQMNHCTFAEGDAAAEGDKASLPTIVPMPTGKQWQARKDAGVDRVVTAVTGVFERADDPKITKTICRKVFPGKPGKYEAAVEVDGAPYDKDVADALGISPLGIELSALHMGRLAHLRLGQEDPLADGVRSLTGLRAIADLAETTAPKIAKYLSGAYARGCETDAKGAAAQFADEVEKLRESFDGADTLPPLPSVPPSRTCRDELKILNEDLKARANKVRAAVAEAAGVAPDDVDLEQLEDRLLTARDALTAEAMQEAGVAKMVAAAETWNNEDVKALEIALSDALSRANDFAKAQEDKLKIVRRRHYALIGKALMAEGGTAEVDDCPTCLRALSDEEWDATLGLPVQTAIRQGADERDDLELTQARFIEALSDQVWKAVPDAIKGVAKDVKQLPDGTAWADSCRDNAEKVLKAHPALKELAAASAQKLIDDAAHLPAPAEQNGTVGLASSLVGTRVEAGILLLRRLLSLHTWAKDTAKTRAQLLSSIYGITGDEAEPAEGSLRRKIGDLRSLLKDDKPGGRRIYKSLVRLVDEWETAQARVGASRDAAEALKKLGDLSTIVSVQIGGLFKRLNTEMVSYRDLFYAHPGYEGARASEIDHDGSALRVAAETDGARGSAHSITNSSQIRAHLFGFVLALLKRVWSRSGGLELVVLDDPQLLFDEMNQERLAQGLVKIQDDDFRLVIMTFDRVFADRIGRAGNCSVDASSSKTVARWRLIPRGGAYENANVERAVEDLVRLRFEWQERQGDPTRIKLFCGEARQFIELTLVDFLGESQAPVSDDATLSPLMQRVRRLIKDAKQVPDPKPFKDLLALLPDGAEEKQELQHALNRSNHYSSGTLSPRHARAVHDMLEQFLKLREQCFDVLAGRTRAAAVPQAANTDEPVAAPAPAAQIRVAGRLAAGEVHTGPAGEEDVPAGELLAFDPEGHQAFGLGGAAASLPYPLSSSSMLICDREASTPRKGDFVVVRDRRSGKALPGWCRPEGENLLLAGVPGSHQASYPLASVEVFPIVAALFDGGARDPRPCQPLDNPEAFTGLCVAAEITEGDSAAPLIRKQDYALLAESVSPDQVFSAPTDAVFAVQLGDERWVVKRVGGPAGRVVRQLLPLGTAGNGEVVTAEEMPFGTIIKKAYPVVGFVRR